MGIQNVPQTDINTGLTEAQVRQQRARFGRHILATASESSVALFFRQLKSPFIYILLVSAAFSLFLGDAADFMIIITIVVINALLSFVQEYRASRAARLLASYIIPTAHVRRNGKDIIVETKELVPGDVVIVSPGDAVPADMALQIADNLTVDESALTGESTPIEKTSKKDDTSNLFMGSTIITGSGTGIVTATGGNTKYGEITALTLLSPHESSFQQNLTLLSSFFIKLVIILTVCILIANLILKGPEANLLQLILFCVALAVTVTPEALPVVTTFALSEGAFTLAKKKVIVKRLSAIEDLGSITMLCTDKTGTLTENILSVADTLSIGHENLLLMASLTQPRVISAFESATIKKLGTDKNKLSEYTVVNQTDFDPVHRRTSKLIKQGNGYFLVVKGAFEEMVNRCHDLDSETISNLKNWTQAHEKEGQRVIAIAIKKDPDLKKSLSGQENELSLCGLIAFADPIKPTVAAALHKAESLDIKIKILTGDSADVAISVARSIGLIKSPDEVITGAQLENLSHTEQHAAIDEKKVFARVTPQQKYAIVEHLRLHDTVGFLGDGINDAPALKAAHVGMVVYKASDIARSVADIILMKKSLLVIIDGIAEGRKVFVNTTKYIKTTLSANMGNFYSLALASLFLKELPMLPIQLLVVNLIADFPMVAIATDNVEPEELRHPSAYSLRELGFSSFIFGSIATIFDFIVFAVFAQAPIAVLRTAWFLVSIFGELLFIVSMRTKKFVLQTLPPSWPLICLIVGSASLGLLLPYTEFGHKILSLVRLQSHTISVVLCIVFGYFIGNEIVKAYYYRSANQKIKKIGHTKHAPSKTARRTS